jgi:hypothetical protein
MSRTPAHRPASILTACAVLALLGALLAVAPPAPAATDTTAPYWTMPPTTSIPLGARLSTSLGDCGDSLLATKVSWKAADPESGIDHYAEDGYYDDPRPIGLTTSAIEPSAVEYDVCGGDEDMRAWSAINGAGLSTPIFFWGTDRLAVLQDDGSLASNQGISMFVDYSGTWTTSKCACFSGGTTMKTTQKGASATFRIYTRELYQPGPFALALSMPKAPDRSNVAIYVNDVKVATINNYSAAKINSTIVWRQSFPEGQTPVIKVVNLATAGHTRSDIDAVVYLRK